MNENINLTKILKNCPRGWKFYSSIYGEVEFDTIINDDTYPIVFITKRNSTISVMSNGRHVELFDGECTLFPSKERRDWSKFYAPWYEKVRFNPATFQPFDYVLTRSNKWEVWVATLFSHIGKDPQFKFNCNGSFFKYCIPYNDETKHLVGAKDEAPEFYRYWED